MLNDDKSIPPDRAGTHLAGRRRNKAAVHQIILKLVQACNLNCTYCYVYNRGDDSWKSRPALVSEEVIIQLAHRIEEHCTSHDIRAFTVEFHGGEPLLLGKERFRRVVELLLENCSVALHLTLQTNGLLLDREWLEIFAHYKVTIGVSLDGPARYADKFRVLRADGSGSTERVLSILKDLQQVDSFHETFSGCLCVVNPELDGGATVDWFMAQGIGTFDFLLPDGNRINLPAGWRGAGEYGRFLLQAFERWYSLGDRAPRIRKFELMLGGLMGGDVQLDALGGDLRLLCVVESDGSIGLSDVTRLCGGEYSRDIVSIFHDRLDAHVERYRVDEIQRVCRTCASCEYLSACGGGYLPHRFDGEGFDNPSLYCEALFALAARMREVLLRDLPARFHVLQKPDEQWVAQ